MGESRNELDKVVILGGGLAGLTAAYYLKKNQVPFRLFEGSQRFGGRIWTLKNLNVSSQYADLGGERIEMEHAAIQSLATELKVGLSEISPLQDWIWLDKGKAPLGSQEKREILNLQKLFSRVGVEAYGSTPQILNRQNQDQFPRAAVLDRLSAEELFSRLNQEMGPSMKLYLEQLIRFQWGVESSQISSLQVLHWIRDSFRPFGGKYLKVSGGTSVLTQALVDRISGVLPERFVKMGQKLIAIRKEETSWRLVFSTASGEVEVKTQKVICTLPAAQLRKVDGWEKLPLSEATKAFMTNQNLGSHSQVILGFPQRFWRNQKAIVSGGTVLMDSVSQNFREAGVPPSELLTSLHGLIQSQIGGSGADKVGPHSTAQVIRDLLKLDLKWETKNLISENVEHFHNWHHNTWSEGSRAFFKPGQFQLFDLTPAGSDWICAGEAHSAAYFGTMNGAVQSAIAAARTFVKS